MSLALEQKDRRVIPRWRDFRTTVQSGDLSGGSPDTVTAIEDAGYFDEKLAAWQVARSIEAAADLVSSALVLGRHDEAAEAARFLLSPECTATLAVKGVAEVVSRPPDEAGRVVIADLKDLDLEADIVRLRIHALRSQLRDAPRNGLLWVDLSRAYSVLGQREQSIGAMERALALVQDNRFVLRSAARLFVHVDEPDRAHQVLLRSDSTRHDPWLLAAEIAVAVVADRSPQFVKQGRHVLERRGFPPRQIAELASAMATLEMGGDTRRARQLFRESLVDPTDNSLAQAEWAATKMSGVDVAPKLLETPRSFEARALEDYRVGRWALAIHHAEDWLLDEPFSSRPAALGSYLAGVAEQDWGRAEEFARRGLRANPGEALLVNNLVVALANRGQVEDASETFAEIRNAPEVLKPTLLATEGLLYFRRGHTEHGRKLYLDAIEAARRQGDARLVALAAVHLAREEVLSGSESADSFLNAAGDACAGLDLRELPYMLEYIHALHLKRSGDRREK